MLTPKQEAALKNALNKTKNVQGEYITIDCSSCVSCGACVGLCPVDALSFQGELIAISSECIGCEYCIDSCPVEAIEKL